MNIAVAIGGVAAVVFLLVALLGGAITFLVVVMPLRLASRLLHRIKYFVLAAVCLALVVTSLLANIHAFAVCNILLSCGATEAQIFDVVFPLVFAMASRDIQLARYISARIPCDSAPESVPQPEDYAKRFGKEEPRPRSDRLLLPAIALATQLWMAIVYFGVCKVLVGGLSAVSIFCSVIQPAIVFTGGNAPVFSTAFRSDPIAFVAVVVLSCVVGGVGLVLVAVLSVKLTWNVFENPKEQQEPATPPLVATATSFTPLEPATPTAAASASV